MFKNCSRSSRLAALAVLGLLAAPLSYPAVAVGQAAAQEYLEQRYQRAVELYRSGETDKAEDACELFQQIEKEKPGYKETRTYLGPACLGVKGAYATEERLFKAGVELLNQKRLEEAKQKFEQARGIQLKHPRHRTEIDGYLKGIEAQVAKERLEREDAAWGEAMRLFTNRDYSSARHSFEEVRRMNGHHKGEAERYLREIDAAEANQRADRQLFDEAVRAYDERRYPDAKALFEQLIQKASPQAAQARDYMQRIAAATATRAPVVPTPVPNKVEPKGSDPRNVAGQLVAGAKIALESRLYASAVEKLKRAESLDPANREVRSLLSQAQELAAEEPLREGLQAYFQGQYDQAERRLSEYVANHGRKLALAYFFRGAVHGSLYFLSGERDTQQKVLALADFRTLQENTKQFQPPKKYVSPKILSLYSGVAGAR